jgi:hypothetical protein
VRTTVTIDSDVATELEGIRRRQGGSFKQVLNHTLREGLRRLNNPERGTPFTTRSVSLGRCLIGNLDDVADALEIGEGPEHR